MDKYLVQTQSQIKSSGIKLPEVHGIRNILDTNTLPEKQMTSPQVKKNIKIKPNIGQDRVGIKCKIPHVTKNIDTSADKLPEDTENTCYSIHG